MDIDHTKIFSTQGNTHDSDSSGRRHGRKHTRALSRAWCVVCLFIDPLAMQQRTASTTLCVSKPAWKCAGVSRSSVPSTLLTRAKDWGRRHVRFASTFR